MGKNWFVEELKINDNEATEKDLKINEKNEFKMYLYGKGWYKLKPKTSILNEVNNDCVLSLDTSILSKYILDDLLHIKDIRKDSRIKFAGGIKGLKYLSNSINQKKSGVAFALVIW